MEFRTLHYFLTVAQERNITRAAEKLHMAQPPLTRQIQQLGQIGQKLHGTISLGTTEASGATILSELVAAFHETAPHIRFQILAGDGTESQNRLEQNLVDMGIVREPFNLEPYDYILLRREPWGILCRADHPLAKQNPETVALDQLRDIPLMLPMRQSIQDDINRWLGQSLPERNLFCLYRSTFSILGLAEKGVGVILATQSAQAFIDPAKLAYRTIVEPSHQSRLFLVKRRGQIMTPAASLFWKFVQEYPLHQEP